MTPMKNLLVLILLSFICESCSNKSMPAYDPSKLSPPARQLLEALQNDDINNPSASLISKYQLKAENGIYYVKGLMKVQDGFDDQRLDELAVKQMTKAGNIRTVRIPITQIAALSKIESIDLIEIDRPLKTR